MILACVINWTILWAAVSSLASIATLIVAIKALNTWHNEKDYDLTVENLALCNSAIAFIEILRSTIKFKGEITDERYKLRIAEHEEDNPGLKQAAEDMFLYQSRKDRQQAVYDKILTIRERNWAAFGEQDIFYKFYNRIIELDDMIRRACITYYQIVDESDEYDNVVYKKRLKDARRIMYSFDDDKDDIQKELKEWVVKLTTQRKRLRKLSFGA